VIYCVWYPSGGYGHFINAILSLHGDNFVRPANNLKFSINGNSHALDLPVPKYLHNPENYFFKFDTDKNYSVLIDNGINDESEQFQKIFTDAKIIKICYNDYSWPIIARTMIEKAMNIDLESHVNIDLDKWNTTEDWALREKYFLFLRDHPLRYAWKIQPTVLNFNLEYLLDYSLIKQTIQNFGIKLGNFKLLWNNWKKHNKKYIDPVMQATQIMQSLESRQFINFNHSDVWTQSVVYYFIYIKYHFEIPHNDYSKYFTNTKDIANMLNTHGVII
jgi:hypothetical protein